MRRRRFQIAGSVGFLAIVLLALPAVAGPGDLDPTFDGDGVTAVDVGELAGMDPVADEAFDVVIDAEGRSVVAGVANGQAVVARFRDNGSPDPAFGTGGVVFIPSSIGGGTTLARAVAMQDLGGPERIVAGGQECDDGGDCTWWLARLLDTGMLDTSFGDAGVVAISVGDDDVRENRIEGLAVQGDDKIVAVGVAIADSPPSGNPFDRFLVARFLPDADNPNAGADPFDPDFGEDSSGGSTTVSPCTYAADVLNDDPFPGPYYEDGDERGYDVALQADGKIVAVGLGPDCVQWGPDADDDFLVARLNADGLFDTTFGSIPPAEGLRPRPRGAEGTRLGWTHTDFHGPDDGSVEGALGVTIQPDGKIVAAGTIEPGSGGSNDNFVLARYHDLDVEQQSSAGDLDVSFDGDGRVETDFEGRSDGATDVAMQGTRIVAAGFTQPEPPCVECRFPNPPSAPTDFAVVGYQPSGALDPVFGNGGKVSIDFADVDLAWAVAVQPADLKVVVAGSEALGDFGDFSLAPRPRQAGFISFALARLGTAGDDVGGAGGLLTVIPAGEGRGMVTSFPPGISCPPTCRSSFPVDRLVQLFAWPNQGSVFTEWGAECDGSGLCLISMTGGDHLVVARYGLAGGTASADLVLAKTGSGDEATVGDPFTYSLTVTNDGSAAASAVTLSDPLLAHVEFVGASSSQGTCGLELGTVACDLGGLAAGASAEVEIVVVPYRGGRLVNTATVSASQADPDTGNNVASLEVPSQAICTITGTAGPDELTGTDGIDVICGLGGDDVLIGLQGHDVISGGAGDDELVGGAGNDLLRGGKGRDLLRGIDGVAANDSLIAGGGVDRCRGDERDVLAGC